MEDEPFDFNTPITENTVLLAKWDCPVEGHTIQDLLDALKASTAEADFPVNTQIDDYTNGSYDPWIVGHYGAQYGDSDTTGVYLYRKYVHPIDKAWGAGDSYADSDINTYLNGDYYNSCSDAIKSAVAETNVPLVNGTTPAKMFLMSAAEVMGMNAGYAGGIEWDGWKERTDLTAPSTQPNAGRVMAKGEIANGSGDPWRLRTEMENNSGEASVTFDGAIRAITSSVESGIVPACFVPVPKAKVPTTLTELKQMLQNDEEIPIGTEIPDTLGGVDNPLIVAQKLDSSNNQDYGGVEGIILLRKYTLFDMSSASAQNYDTDTFQDFLQTTSFNKCSDEAKSIFDEIAVKFYPFSEYTAKNITGKVFLPSITEIMGVAGSRAEGIAWELWKERTGLTEPSNDNNPGRVQGKMEYGSFSSVNWRLRSYFYDSSGTGTVAHVDRSGAVIGSTGQSFRYLLYAYFVSKN